MKILLIDVNCKYSSTGKIVYDLYKRFNADGHEARIAYGRGDVIDEPGIYKFGLDWETKIHAAKATEAVVATAHTSVNTLAPLSLTEQQSFWLRKRLAWKA